MHLSTGTRYDGGKTNYKVFFFQTGQAMPKAAQETPAAVAFSTKQSCKPAKQSPFDKKKNTGQIFSFMFILTQKHPRSMEEEQATAQDWTNWPALLSPVSLSSTSEMKPSEAKQCKAKKNTPHFPCLPA